MLNKIVKKKEIKILQNKMSKKSKIIYFFVTSVFFVMLDLYFSNLIIENLRFKVCNNPIFDLILVKNSGAAFSIMENKTIFLVLFSMISIIALLYYIINRIDRISIFIIFWTSILIAGISCNMYERITLGYVNDFFKLNFIDFPVFNISDIFINLSVFAIVIIIVSNRYFVKK